MDVLNLKKKSNFLNYDERHIPHKGKWRHSNYQANLKIVGIQEAELKPTHYQLPLFLPISNFQKPVFLQAISNMTYSMAGNLAMHF